MTAVDGNPLTGDPDSDAVRHLLALIVPPDRDTQADELAAARVRVEVAEARAAYLVEELARRDGLRGMVGAEHAKYTPPAVTP